METNTTPEPAVQLLPDLPPSDRFLILHAQRKLLRLRCARGLSVDSRSVANTEKLAQEIARLEALQCQRAS